MFEKLKMTFSWDAQGTDRSRAKKAYNLVNDADDAETELKKKLRPALKAAVDSGDIEKVSEAFHKIIDWYHNQAFDYFRTSRIVNILEHRLATEVSKVTSGLGKLRTEEAKRAIAQYQQAVETARNKLNQARKQSRDLKRNWQHLKDKSLIGQGLLFEGMRLETRHLKVAANPSSSIVDSLLSVEKRAASGKIKPEEMASAMKQIEAEIKKFAGVLDSEVALMAKVEQNIVILSFRLNHLNQEDIAEVQHLVAKGFPDSEARQIIALNQAKFLDYQRGIEKQQYRFARTVYKEFRDEAKDARKAA